MEFTRIPLQLLKNRGSTSDISDKGSLRLCLCSQVHFLLIIVSSSVKSSTFLFLPMTGQDDLLKCITSLLPLLSMSRKSLRETWSGERTGKWFCCPYGGGVEKDSAALSYSEVFQLHLPYYGYRYARLTLCWKAESTDGKSRMTARKQKKTNDWRGNALFLEAFSCPPLLHAFSKRKQKPLLIRLGLTPWLRKR